MSASAIASVRVDAAIGRWSRERPDVPIWTGHQPWLWHPGILAKYLAIDAAIDPGGRAINLVVDHDAQDALRLVRPVRNGEAWSAVPINLGPMLGNVPAGCQRAIDAASAVRVLRDHARTHSGASLERLIAAWSAPEVREASTLGQQIAHVLFTLLKPWLEAMWEDRFSTALCEEPGFVEELQTLLREAKRMADAYNRAAAGVPQAGLSWLGRGREWIELPVWLLRCNRPRQRVYADVSDTTPWLIDKSGERLDWEAEGVGRDGVWLAPKALWMTALIRRRHEACSGFVHGTGGATYDRAMEAWWSGWRNEPLAPMAMATADATLRLAGPSAQRADLARAAWAAHHLPHNLNRESGVAAAHPELVAEKAALLADMHRDRDRRRRRTAFDRIHAINAALADAHHVLIDRAEHARDQVEIGIENEALRHKRDWSFAFYPDETLGALQESIRNTAATKGVCDVST